MNNLKKNSKRNLRIEIVSDIFGTLVSTNIYSAQIQKIVKILEESREKKDRVFNSDVFAVAGRRDYVRGSQKHRATW